MRYVCPALLSQGTEFREMAKTQSFYPPLARAEGGGNQVKAVTSCD